jgi:hypothetical protein
MEQEAGCMIVSCPHDHWDEQVSNRNKETPGSLTTVTENHTGIFPKTYQCQETDKCREENTTLDDDVNQQR